MPDGDHLGKRIPHSAEEGALAVAYYIQACTSFMKNMMKVAMLFVKNILFVYFWFLVKTVHTH